MPLVLTITPTITAYVYTNVTKSASNSMKPVHKSILYSNNSQLGYANNNMKANLCVRRNSCRYW